MTARYLHGIHDPGGEHLFGSNPGWITHTVSLREESPRDYQSWESRGIGNIVRLNWGYGSTGTIPLQSSYYEFARLCASYVNASPGCTRWIIGNEPNHRNEWPEGQKITPQMYAQCYTLCRQAIKSVKPNDEVLVAAIAPWNAADAGPWMDYFREVISSLNGNYDGFAIHAYTHGDNPALVRSDLRMAPPFEDCHWHFRVYRDWCRAIPQNKRHLPVYGTEFNQGDGPWRDANTGYVQEVYREIEEWNRLEGEAKIMCFCLYRWPNYDQWGIRDKVGVHEDFRKAALSAHRVFLPLIPGSTDGEGSSAPGSPPLSVDPPRNVEWDERLTEYGVRIVTPTLVPGSKYWKITKASWYDVNEVRSVGPDHHILVDVLVDGRRAVGKTLLVTWPDGEARIVTQSKPRELWAADYPMSPGKFDIKVENAIPSEKLTGVGMGMVVPGGFNPGIHTSTFVQWELVTVSGEGPVANPNEKRLKIALVHPVENPAYRRVTQNFGERPSFYEQYKVDGVPLKGHNGVDFGTPLYSNIVAVDVGRVVEVADEGSKGYGKYIKLTHAWGESLYAHLNDQWVMVGDTVRKGQHLGRSGSTGNSSGPHLHFGLRVAPFNRSDGWGGFIDPLPYLSGAETPVDEPLENSELLRLVQEASREFGLKYSLVVNVVWAESSFRKNVTSNAGAMGLMGIARPTWDEWSVKLGGNLDPFKPIDNLRVGCAYLDWLLDYFGGSRLKALTAYNWGIGNVLSGKQAPIETIIYVHKIIHGDDLLTAMGI